MYLFLKRANLCMVPDVAEVRRYCKEQVATLWDEMLRFEKPQTYYVDLSQKLWDMKNSLINQHMDEK